MEIFPFLNILLLLLYNHSLNASGAQAKNERIVNRSTPEEDEETWNSHVRAGSRLWAGLQRALQNPQRFPEVPRNIWHENTEDPRELSVGYCGPGGVVLRSNPIACIGNYDTTSFSIADTTYFKMRMNADRSLIVTSVHKYDQRSLEMLVTWPSLLLRRWTALCNQHRPIPISPSSLQSLVLGFANDVSTLSIIRHIARQNPNIINDSVIIRWPDPNFLALMATFWGNFVLALLSWHARDLVRRNDVFGTIQTVKTLQYIRLTRRPGVNQEGYDIFFQLEDVRRRNIALGHDQGIPPPAATTQPAEPQIFGVNNVLSAGSWFLQRGLEQGPLSFEGTSLSSEVQSQLQSSSAGQQANVSGAGVPEDGIPEQSCSGEPPIPNEPSAGTETSTRTAIISTTGTPTDAVIHTSTSTSHDGPRCRPGFWRGLCGCVARPSVVLR